MGVFPGADGYFDKRSARQEPSVSVLVRFEDDGKGGCFHVDWGSDYHRYPVKTAHKAVAALMRAIRQQRKAERAMTAEYGPRLA